MNPTNPYYFTLVECEHGFDVHIHDGETEIGVTRVKDAADALLAAQEYVAVLADLPDRSKVAMVDQTVWGLHLAGPDDLIPMPSRQFAEKKAEEMNVLFRLLSSIGTPNPDAEPILTARVVPWNGTVEDHAAAMQQIVDQGDGEEWYQLSPRTRMGEADA